MKKTFLPIFLVILLASYALGNPQITFSKDWRPGKK
uniref:Z-limacoditoxin(1)-Dv4 n=1 Tax=Doratifera vulnerans TaxID=1372962 RepID=Z14_DORVU|nr:RecName: Full=Z-limacoditoxin(1)-Dv4; Short=Z-LCTX(1)-Dv4; AltName: Full=Vulnericin; Flags: Precursor [Doratifera vulnerans]QTY40775.1 venom polypeptide precursor [Doratifera vulnerans]